MSRRTSTCRLLQVENLEDRQLLSATVIQAGGLLTITGTGLTILATKENPADPVVVQAQIGGGAGKDRGRGTDGVVEAKIETHETLTV